MKIADRLARLERRDDADARMTAAEIDEAAGRYQQALGEEPAGARVVSLPGWHTVIAAARPSWFQRALAAASPADWFA